MSKTSFVYLKTHNTIIRYLSATKYSFLIKDPHTQNKNIFKVILYQKTGFECSKLDKIHNFIKKVYTLLIFEYISIKGLL